MLSIPRLLLAGRGGVVRWTCVRQVFLVIRLVVVLADPMSLFLSFPALPAPSPKTAACSPVLAESAYNGREGTRSGPSTQSHRVSAREQGGGAAAGAVGEQGVAIGGRGKPDAEQGKQEIAEGVEVVQGKDTEEDKDVASGEVGKEGAAAVEGAAAMGGVAAAQQGEDERKEVAGREEAAEGGKQEEGKEEGRHNKNKAVGQQHAPTTEPKDNAKPTSAHQQATDPPASHNWRDLLDHGAHQEPPVKVRPRFHCARGRTRNHQRAPLEQMKSVQGQQLQMFRHHANRENWSEIHRAHFDWYMFPIEDGSQMQYNVFREDVQELKQDAEWLAGYHEGVELVSRAWGWDVKSARLVEEGLWTHWDVRLAKMIRSLWLFEEFEMMESLQTFARLLKPNGGFRYAGINLDEILWMRRDNESERRARY